MQSTRKIFCVGANKTGTSSITQVFRRLGFRVGNQARAELLIHAWARNEFAEIVDYCRTANAFQDIPFSYPKTFIEMDGAFPGAKFILSVRGSADEWFESLVRYHMKLLRMARVPTANDLKNCRYRYKGFLWDTARLRYGATEETVYDRALYTRCYETHNARVTRYFRDRPDDLLILNVADRDAMERLMTFLGYRYSGETMPHVNTSR